MESVSNLYHHLVTISELSNTKDCFQRRKIWLRGSSKLIISYFVVFQNRQRLHIYSSLRFFPISPTMDVRNGIFQFFWQKRIVIFTRIRDGNHVIKWPTSCWSDLLNKTHELYVKLNVIQNRLSNDNQEMDKFLIQWQIMLIQILPFLYL